MGGQSLGVNDYLSVRAGVVATRAYRVVQQQGYLGFEESTRRDFARLGGQAIKVMKAMYRGEWRQRSVRGVGKYQVRERR